MNTTLRLLSLSTLAGIAFSNPAWSAAHARDTFIQQYDTNHDDKVERAEFDAARTVRFKSTDNDGNGTISTGEYLSEYVAQLDGQLLQSKDSEADKTVTRQRQYRQTSVRFAAMDTDKDQQISKAEYDASGTRSFDNHDSDKDAAVTVNDAVSDNEGRAAAR